MPEVTIKKGEPVDRALKRLKGKLESEGILEEVRRLRAFETPIEKTRRKARANAKRRRGRQRFILNPPKPREDKEGGEERPAHKPTHIDKDNTPAPAAPAGVAAE